MKLIIATMLFISLAVPQQSKIKKSARSGYESITVVDLKKHLTILASDSLEGRETAMPGQKKAARYIAGHFKKLGLKPLGDSGTYFQRFDLDVTRLSDASSVSVKEGAASTSFAFWKDALTFSRRDTVVRGNVVFVGFMDAKFDSATAAKFAGRIILAFSGAKASASDTSASLSRRQLVSGRRDPGALGLLAITAESGGGSFDRLQATLRSFGTDKPSMSLKGVVRPTRAFGSGFSVFVSPALANTILKSSGSDVSQLRAAALFSDSMAPIFMDNVEVTVSIKSSKEVWQSENVVGLLEGTDPKLKEEAVIFTAHYDHLGKSSDGTIFHGADDDGSGTSMVMELAEAFVKNKVKPKRSVIFMTVAGEEKGLLGSSYYSEHPNWPLEKTIADLNTDMIGRIDTIYEKMVPVPNYTYVIGSDKISTELDSILQVANREGDRLTLDMTYNDPNDPNQFYRRSDHYNFAKKGVPIAFFFTGEHRDYHRPTDTVDKIEFARQEKIGKLVYYTGWKLANAPRMLKRNVEATEYK
jgi:hypothetical protein